MSNREFPLQIVGDGPVGARRKLPTIHCSECNQVEHFASNGVKRPPPEAAAQHFRKLGWRVGGGPRADVCPACLAKKRGLATEIVSRLTDAPSEANEPQAVTSPVPPARPSPSELPPRTMSFADRRLVMIKLEEVYMDERQGYVAPWSDQRVADDLNVPRAWVKELREQNFGPVDGSSELDEIRAALDALREEFRALFAAGRVNSEAEEEQRAELLNALERQFGEYRSKLAAMLDASYEDLKQRLVPLQKAMDKLDDLDGRVDRLMREARR